MAERKRKVLITGAAGYVASQMRDQFAELYNLVLADVTDRGRDGKPVPGVKTADFIDSERSNYRHLFEGVDAVIHLSYKRSSAGGVFGDAVPHIDRFAVENENVVMANNVYRAAYEAGVRRMVVASSNHAADWYEHALVHRQKKDVVQPWEYPVSDNFYGWAKAAYELLAWPYASGKFGRQILQSRRRPVEDAELDGREHRLGAAEGVNEVDDVRGIGRSGHIRAGEEDGRRDRQLPVSPSASYQCG